MLCGAEALDFAGPALAGENGAGRGIGAVHDVDANDVWLFCVRVTLGARQGGILLPRGVEGDQQFAEFFGVVLGRVSSNALAVSSVSILSGKHSSGFLFRRSFQRAMVAAYSRSFPRTAP